MYLYIDSEGRVHQDLSEPDQDERAAIDNGDLRVFKYDGVKVQFLEAAVEQREHEEEEGGSSPDEDEYDLVWVKV